MLNDIKKIFIVTKARDAQAADLAVEIAGWLDAHGVTSETVEHHRGLGSLPCSVNGCDLVLVLGGDGTMLGVAREVAGTSPMLGLNLGRLGFLTEVPRESWQDFLTSLLAGRMQVRRRLALSYTVAHADGRQTAGTVINDIVANRGCLARLINLTVRVDGESLGTMRADGLVLSTPTGSTAYSISAGGPIVHPDIEAVTVTPICPFMNTFRPMVLPAASRIEVVVEDPDPEVFLTIDGQECIALGQGDVITVHKDEMGLLLVEPEAPTYLTRLRAKGVIEYTR